MTEDEIYAALTTLMEGSCPHYTLEGHTPVRAHDFRTWLAWYATADRQVAEDAGPGWRLSTIFLGIGTRHPRDLDDPEEVPALFETCVFREGEHARVCGRVSTWDAAIDMHIRWRSMVHRMPKEP